MKALINELASDNTKRLNETTERFKTELKMINPEKLTSTEKCWLNRSTPYKRSREGQTIARLQTIFNKSLAEKLSKIESVIDAPDKLSNPLVLIINFYKNATWGYCPKGSDNYGHETSSITGCGYCKESTATAQLLNQNETILKRLYKAKNDKKEISYGAYMSGLPTFSGGVGVDCHVRILEELGYKVSKSGNNSTTILTISEV